MRAPGGWRRWCGSTDLRRFRSGAKQWTVDEPGDEARAELQAALKLDPKFKEAKETLTAL